MTTPAQAALDAASHGISVWPPRQDGTKAPDGNWKTGQAKRATPEQIASWYATGRTGIGYITGAVSGNLEVIDFDDRSIWAEFQRLCADAGLAALLAKVSAGYCEHSPNGAHLLYRCSQIEPNQKLAKRPDGTGWKSIIETRGEGGYIIAAPSHGGVNLKGPYVMVSGGPSTIVTITPEERRALFDVARIFDESPRQAAPEPRLAVSAAGRPGDDYCARTTWEEVLEPHGWVKAGGRLGVTSWRRPGKDHGISATTGHAGTDLLYVFSSSTCFESERGYNKFSAYCLLNHNGDFAAAAHALSMLGYGLEVPEDDNDVDLSLLLARGSKPAEPPELVGLLRVPGLVGDMAEWMNSMAIKPQPVIAVGASIAAMATIIGRKAAGHTGLRSNMYVLGIGETGCGKEAARKAIGQLFFDLGIDNTLGDAFASDAAVETAMSQHPCRLYMIDELGHFMGTMRDEMSPGHVKSIIPVLLRFYSASDGVYRRRTYANAELNQDQPIVQPCLSIYGSTVPQNFYANVTKAQLSNGLLSRLIVFESDDPDPEEDLTKNRKCPTPKSILDGCRIWVDRGINDNPDAGNIEQRTIPEPMEIPATSRAVDVFVDLSQTMRRIRAKERENGRDPGPWVRVTATALKLAMIRASGVNPEQPEVTSEDADWGCGLAWRLTADFLAKLGDAAPENKHEEYLQRVLGIVRRAGRIGRSELVSKTNFVDPKKLTDILNALIEGGSVKMSVEPTGGRPKAVYEAR